MYNPQFLDEAEVEAGTKAGGEARGNAESEAVAVAMKHKDMVNMTDAEIEDYVQDGWNEVWSEYAFG